MGLRMLLLKLQSQWRDAFHHHCKLRTQLEQSYGAPGKLQPCVAADGVRAVSYTHLRAHETVLDLVCRLLLALAARALALMADTLTHTTVEAHRLRTAP